jgi:hypothetical protein
MISFPMYALRPFQELMHEGDYTILQTAKTRYVLDIDVPDTTYAERRLMLLADPLKPYNLYPLNQRVETINQILLTKRKKFIDSTGKILSWKPTVFYPVVCLPIKSRWTTATGKGVIEVKGLATKFIVSNNNFKYAQVIQAGRKNILYDLCDEYRKQTRKKL